MTYSDRFRLRAWSKEEKEMYYDVEGQYDNCCNGMGTMAHQCLTDLLEDDRYIVEQCTGLKDANGCLLYEGDIVNILCEVEEQGVIEWAPEEAQFVVRAEQAGFVANFDNYRGTDLEVIGNIHENADLLEEEKNEQKEIGAA